MKSPTAHIAFRHGVIGGVVTLLSACGLLAEEVTPAQRGLEIIFAREEHACSVNFAEVGAGEHPVSVIAGSVPATVRILDDNGSVLLRTKAEPEPEPGSDGKDDEVVAVPATGDYSVELDAGDYEVECLVGASTSTVPLHVTP